MDYTAKYPQKLVTLELKNGDRFEVLAHYDETSMVWFSSVLDLEYAIHNVQHKILSGGKRLDDLISETEFATVPNFCFMNKLHYSDGSEFSKLVLNKQEIRYRRER